MNQFEYKLAINKAETAKTLLELEAIIRTYYNNAWRYKVLSVLEYQVVSCALARFKAKSKRKLPDFVYLNYRRNSEELLRKMLIKPLEESTVTYEEFMHIFRYGKNLRFPTNYGDLFRNLSNIVGPNPMPIVIDYNISLDSRIASICTASNVNTRSTALLPQIIANIIQIEAIKTSMPSKTIRYTIIEEELTELYKQHLKPIKSEAKEDITFYLKNALRALNTVDTKLKLKEQHEPIHNKTINN